MKHPCAKVAAGTILTKKERQIVSNSRVIKTSTLISTLTINMAKEKHLKTKILKVLTTLTDQKVLKVVSNEEMMRRRKSISKVLNDSQVELNRKAVVLDQVRLNLSSMMETRSSRNIQMQSTTQRKRRKELVEVARLMG